MSNANLDAETTKAVAEGEALDGLFASSGWQIAEQNLLDLVGLLRDVRNINMKSDDVAVQIKVNAGVADGLEQWVADLKGRVNNVIMMKDSPVNKKLVERR